MGDDTGEDQPVLRIHGGAGAAEVAALTALLTEEEAPDGAGPEDAPWLRASLREGVGGSPVAEPTDLG